MGAGRRIDVKENLLQWRPPGPSLSFQGTHNLSWVVSLDPEDLFTKEGEKGTASVIEAE